MDLHLKDKVAVVCGGSTGIGQATAKQFAAEGCKVAVCSRSREKIDAFIADFRAQGVEDFIAETVDATDKAQVDAFAKQVVDRYGKIDIWVNCAGGNRHGPLDTLAVEDYRFIIDLNLTSMFNGYQAACRYMIPAKSGVVINVASLAGKTGVAYRALYGAIKSGVINLTATIAAEVAPYNIRVVSVSPGVIYTALMKKAIEEDHDNTVSKICLRRAGMPDEVAKPIVFLASDAASYITGTDIAVAGGKLNVDDASLPWVAPWGK